MSRCIVKAKDPKQEIVVGLDPMLHEWFWQVFTVNDDPGKFGEWIGGSDTFMPPSKSDLIEFMELNCYMSDPYTKAVTGMIMLDLDPGTVEVPNAG